KDTANAVKGAAQEVKPAVKNVADSVKETVEEAKPAFKDAAKDTSNAVKGAAQEVKSASNQGVGLDERLVADNKQVKTEDVGMRKSVETHSPQSLPVEIIDRTTSVNTDTL
ncbi:MAG: hypothetical protein V7L12_32100, partial [Nostoc sp.]